MRHESILLRPTVKRAFGRSPRRGSRSWVALALLLAPSLCLGPAASAQDERATLDAGPGTHYRFAVDLPYRSVSVTPDYQSGSLAGLTIQIQDEADQPVTGRWPVMLTLYCDSGCTGPGQHADPAEVAFANGGYMFLGLTQLNGSRYLSLTTATIGAGINIVGQVLADNQALVSPVRSRYAELLAGAGLHYLPDPDESDLDESAPLED